MSVAPSERHLRPEGLVEYLAADVPTVVPIEGQPAVMLAIDPVGGTLALRVQTPAGDLPELSSYEYFESGQAIYDGLPWNEVRVVGASVLLDAYPLLCAIADRVQIDDQRFRPAVLEVLGAFKELLRGLGRLSDHEEVGLFGELLVLRRLAKSLGFESAVDAWRGADREEHDFGLGALDLEVKSTVAEDRRHRVTTLSQLEPTEGRDLWLASIQLTTAGIGGANLPQVVDAIRDKIVEAQARDRFEALLDASRYSDAHASVYTRRFRLRSAPATFLVDGAFPAITRPLLAGAGLALERVDNVSYVIDLGGLATAPAPPELADVIAGGQDE